MLIKLKVAVMITGVALLAGENVYASAEASASTSSNRVDKGMSVAEVRQNLHNALFPTAEDVKPVKAAGVFIFTKDENGRTGLAMGRMRKDDPKKKAAHVFNGTYSVFSGGVEDKEEAIDAAARELAEETESLFGDTPETLSLLAQPTTQVIKNMNWKSFPVASYLVTAEHFDVASAYAARVTPDSEMTRVDWISLDSIWKAVDYFEIPGTGLSWGKYNSADHLKAIFTPLNSLYSDREELELAKNKLKYHLPAKTLSGHNILIADYVARTLVENRALIMDFVAALGAPK